MSGFLNLSADEMQSIRDDLNSRRRPGTYERGKWGVSQYNRDPRAFDLTLPSFPASVTLRDITLRCIQQGPGVSLSDAEWRRLGAAIVESGVPSMEIAAFPWRTPADELKQQIRFLKSINPDLDVKIGGLETEDKIDFAAEAGATSVDFWLAAVPSLGPVHEFEPYYYYWEGRDPREIGVPTTLEGQIERGARWAARARQRGIKIGAGLNMVAFADDEHLERYSRGMDEAGVDQIGVFDSSAGMSPEAMAYAVSVVRRSAPHCQIAVHTHNDFGLGLANSLTSIRAGAEIVEITVNGLCCDAGQVDLAQIATVLEVMYGVRTGVKLEQMTALARLAEDISRTTLAPNHPLTGRDAFNCGGVEAMVQHELHIDPLLHSSLEANVVGNRRNHVVGIYTGPLTMMDKLAELRIEVDRALIPRVLQEVKEELRVRKRVLSDEEIAGIALWVKGAGE